MAFAETLNIECCMCTHESTLMTTDKHEGVTCMWYNSVAWWKFVCFDYSKFLHMFQVTSETYLCQFRHIVESKGNEITGSNEEFYLT